MFFLLWEWSVTRMNYSICESTSLRYWLQFWITNGDGSEVLYSNVKLSELVWVIRPLGEWGFQLFGFVFLTTDFLPSNIFYEWTTFFNFFCWEVKKVSHFACRLCLYPDHTFHFAPSWCLSSPYWVHERKKSVQLAADVSRMVTFNFNLNLSFGILQFISSLHSKILKEDFLIFCITRTVGLLHIQKWGRN